MAKTDKNVKGWYGGVYWQSDSYTRKLFRALMDTVERLAISRFRWEGLPDSCDARFLETTLYRQGVATIAKPRRKGIEAWLSLMLVQQGQPSMYGNPVRWLARGVNGTSFNVDRRNGVYIFDNDLRRPIAPLLRMYVRELVDVYRTKQLNRMHQKIPYIITAPREQELAVVNILKMLLGGEPAVAGTDELKQIAEAITAVNLEVPYIGDKLTEEEQNIWAKIYAALGITNMTYKAERQIEDEVRAYEEPTDLTTLAALRGRREAAEKLNRISGLDVHVYWNQDFESDNFNFLRSLAEQAEAM